ncbi:hypothetical protein QWZ14_11570 [Paeniroseomonas aquatica]|uniref:Uncharacterized protein n=1 Tax=Paeniroseomonas aquatica TaxID=373043 RepID=A0ABT8A5F6_9PROT|nr:hypothetical protein [Paeniroseomonas aquatica]MDN3564999.1 hypothetical protein [Paeniroseomonas aquatica]
MLDDIKVLPNTDADDDWDDFLNGISRLPGGGAYRDKDNLEDSFSPITPSVLDKPEEEASKHILSLDYQPERENNPTLKPKERQAKEWLFLAKATKPLSPRSAAAFAEPVPSVRPPSNLRRPGGFALAPDRLELKQVAASKLLSLHRTPLTPAAEAFTAEVIRKICRAEAYKGLRQRRRSESAQRQFHQATGALVANLLGAWSCTPPAATSRTLNVHSFTGEDVGRRSFLAALGGMKAAGLIQQRQGGRSKDGQAGIVSRFWPDNRFLNCGFRRRRPPIPISSRPPFQSDGGQARSSSQVGFAHVMVR